MGARIGIRTCEEKALRHDCTSKEGRQPREKEAGSQKPGEKSRKIETEERVGNRVDSVYGQRCSLAEWDDRPGQPRSSFQPRGMSLYKRSAQNFGIAKSE